MHKLCFTGLFLLAAVVSVGAQTVVTNVLSAGIAQPADVKQRMVVANFRAANGDTFRWCGQKESTAAWAAALADKLTERFTQTRRFTMIDRKFDAEVQDEIARLSDKNAAKGDVVRLGQRIGTDYMIVGDVKFGDVQPPVVSPITGQTLPTPSQRFAEISYRLIHVVTGELKWAETVIVESGEAQAADILAFVSMTADIAARRIAESVAANLFAPEAAIGNGVGAAVSQPAAPVATPLNTSVRGTPTGGVVTPF